MERWRGDDAEFTQEVLACAAELGLNLERLGGKYGEVALVIALLEQLGAGLRHATVKGIFDQNTVMKMLSRLESDATLEDHEHQALLDLHKHVVGILRDLKPLNPLKT